MARIFACFLGLLALLAAPALAEDVKIPDRILGNPDAPVTVEEYISLTCPHCADFYTETLPVLKKNYVDTGKVKFILRDFPLDGEALRAAALARCMPADEYYPFIDVLYRNQKQWALAPDPNAVLTEYAKLGGLNGDKAKACLNDTALMDALIAGRTAATQQYNIEATPTFILDGGAIRIDGARSAEEFGADFDKLLAKK
jgi:protein-disulfide isomerase